MRNRYILFADLILIALCATGAFILRLDWFFDSSYLETYKVFLAAALVTKPLVFVAFGLYGRFWRYASVRDMLLIVLAVFAASIALSVEMLAALRLGVVSSVPRSVLFIDWVLTICCVGGVRFGVRLLSEPVRHHEPARSKARQKRLLIAGAGDTGAMVVREMHRNPALGSIAVGFLDDHPAKSGKQIHDVPVLGALIDLEQVVGEESVDEVVIAMPTAPGRPCAPSSSAARGRSPSRALPGIFELLDGRVSVSRLREVDIADLLRRSQICAGPGDGSVSAGPASSSSPGRAARSAASCAARWRAAGAGSRRPARPRREQRLRARDRPSGVASRPSVVQAVLADVRDRERLDARVRAATGPTVVFHAAAHKHVPLMEQNPSEAVTNNVLGTRNVLEACRAPRRRALRADLDRQGGRARPASWARPSGSPSCSCAMPRTRWPTRFVVVRFGNVLGSRGQRRAAASSSRSSAAGRSP